MRTPLAPIERGLRQAVLWTGALAAIGIAGCTHRDTASAVSESPTRWNQADQMVLVTTEGWNSSKGRLRAFERNGDAWRPVGSSHAVTLGRAGSAWGLGLHPSQAGGPVKREGDGRSPAGVFRVGPAFGYARVATTGLDYQAMTLSHYCMDVSGSPLYNQIVDASKVGEPAVAGSTEPMRLDLHSRGDQRYRLGFVLEHNAQAQPMGGSCIFAHLWKSPEDSTSGCTAMDDASMAELLRWLDRKRRPVFVLLPIAEYRRLRAVWKLPMMEDK